MMNKKSLSLPGRLLLTIILLFCSGSVFQEHTRAQAIRQVRYAESSLEGPDDREELEGWLNGFFEKVLDKGYRPAIPGAVFVLVKDGSIFLAKGYGHANLESMQPFDPEQTTVRAASITKTFTATAIMQLAEQGKLDLNADIRDYFPDLNVPSSFSEPITVGDLLTHSAGFDETPFRYATGETVLLLSTYLRTEIPARVAAPNTVLTYSNYSYALAGRLIEIVSGEAYDQYIASHILQPLEMNSSSVTQPVPQRLAARLATGYTHSKDGFHPILERLYPPDEAGGGLTTTAEDMANFLIAQLQNGRYKNTRILQEETGKQMHAQHFTNDPALPGYTYGFDERFENGRRILMHGGGHRDAASLAVLLPDEGVGFFVSMNTSIEISSGGDPREELFVGFMNHYYPENVNPQENFIKADRRFNGVYRITRYVHQGIEKVMKMDAPLTQATVKVNADGTITLKYPFNFVPPTQWRQIQPLVFQNVNKSSDLIAFREDKSGKITHLFGTLVLPFSLERIAWYETLPVQLSIFLASGILFLGIALYFPIRVTISYFRRKKLPMLAWGFLEWMAGITGLIIMISIVIGNATLSGSVKTIMIILKTAGYGFTLLSCGLIFSTVTLWRKGIGSIASRIRYSVVTLVALIFVWFLGFWNIILA